MLFIIFPFLLLVNCIVSFVCFFFLSPKYLSERNGSLENETLQIFLHLCSAGLLLEDTRHTRTYSAVKIKYLVHTSCFSSLSDHFLKKRHNNFSTYWRKWIDGQLLSFLQRWNSSKFTKVCLRDLFLFHLIAVMFVSTWVCVVQAVEKLID